MKAVLLSQYGPAENLYIGDAPVPKLKHGEVLVKVKATALNRADIIQRSGNYPPPEGASDILGLEMSGEVVEVSEGVTSVSIGERVCALLPGGGYAQYVSVPEGLLMKIPDNVTFEQAAAIPETFLTTYQSLFPLGQLAAGQTVLVHAGASGIGTTAIQLIRAAGATVFVTAGSDDKIGYCLKLGATAGWNYKKGSFLPFVKEQTDGVGVNIVLDCVGAPYFEQNILSLIPDGRLVVIGSLGEKVVVELDLGSLLLKRFQLLRTTLRSRTQERKVQLTKDLMEFAGEHFATGQIAPVIDSVFDWTDVQKAHERMETNQNIGKIILRISS